MESEPTESEPPESQPTYGLVVYYGYVGELEYFAWPLMNGTTIDWGELPPGIHRKRMSVKNTGNALVTIIFAVENLPDSWSLTASFHRDTIGPGVQSFGDLILQIPSGAEAKEYLLGFWIKAVIFEYENDVPDRNVEPRYKYVTEVVKLFFRLRLKVV